VKQAIRRGLLTLLFLLCLSGTTLAAEHHGYIIRLEPRVDLLGGEAALPEGVEEVYGPENLYETADEALIAQLEEAGLLVYAEPNYSVELLEEPNDPGWTEGTQWDLAAVKMPAVWELGLDGMAADGTRVRVGVIDSGLYAEHEDLKGAQILPGVNVLAEEGTEERSDTSDAVSHGTFVTGTIAAVAGNGVGIAGMAPGAEVMPIKCFASNTTDVADVVAGIYAGVDAGCRVLNMSFGVTYAKAGQALADAVAYAAERDVIMVAAVGNSGTTTTLYPAGYDTVIGVGSVGKTGTVSAFSHKNPSVFVTAPGGSLYGLSAAGTDSYKTGSGTSFATAEVTAAAALALSLDPTLTPEEFMVLLQQTVTDCGEAGYDTSYGYGTLDLERLLSLLRGGCYTLESPEGENVAVVRASDLMPGSTASAVQVIYDENGAQEAFLLTVLTVGEDGTLKGQIELPSEGRVSLMLMDENWCPVISQWKGQLTPKDPPEDEPADGGAADDGITDGGVTDDGSADSGTESDPLEEASE